MFPGDEYNAHLMPSIIKNKDGIDENIENCLQYAKSLGIENDCERCNSCLSKKTKKKDRVAQICQKSKLCYFLLKFWFFMKCYSNFKIG